MIHIQYSISSNFQKDSCVEICGDGIRFVLEDLTDFLESDEMLKAANIIFMECDDGNIVDGDGCSSLCEVDCVIGDG